MKKLNPPESGTAIFLILLGVLCLLGSVIYGFNLIGERGFSAETGSIIGLFIGISIQLVIIGFIVEKIWDMHFYLRHIANNTHLNTPEQKPLSEEPSSKSGDMEDTSKYTPPPSQF